MANHEIALIRFHDRDAYHEDFPALIYPSITDWAVVTTEELALLRKNIPQFGSNYHNYQVIIEKAQNMQEYVDFTVGNMLKKAKEEEDKKRIASENRKKNAEANRIKKEKKEMEEKRKLLEQLKKELGDNT